METTQNNENGNHRIRKIDVTSFKLISMRLSNIYIKREKKSHTRRKSRWKCLMTIILPPLHENDTLSDDRSQKALTCST